MEFNFDSTVNLVLIAVIGIALVAVGSAVSTYVTSSIVETATNTNNVNTIAGLLDVSVNSPQNNQLLKYDSANQLWVNGFASIPELSDVNISNLNAGDVLQYDGSSWVNDVVALNELSDVDASNPLNNQVLSFDSATGMWVPETISSGGGAGGAVTQEPSFIIYKNGTTYYAVNATDSSIYTSNSDLATVFNALVNLGTDQMISFHTDIYDVANPLIINKNYITVDCNQATLKLTAGSSIILFDPPAGGKIEHVNIYNCKFDLNEIANAVAIDIDATTGEGQGFIRVIGNTFLGQNGAGIYYNLTNIENVARIEFNSFLSVGNTDGTVGYALWVKDDGIVGANMRVSNNVFTGVYSASLNAATMIYFEGPAQLGRVIIADNHLFFHAGTSSSANLKFLHYNVNTGSSIANSRYFIITNNQLENCYICIHFGGTGDGALFAITYNSIENAQTTFSVGNNYGILIDNPRTYGLIIGNIFDVKADGYVSIRSTNGYPLTIEQNEHRLREVNTGSLVAYEITTVEGNIGYQGFIDKNTEKYFSKWWGGSTSEVTRPEGVVATPFDNTNNRIDPLNGNSATPTSGATYTVVFYDIRLIVSGGSGVSISVTDYNGNTIISGATTLDMDIEHGWKVTITYTTAPTITVVV